MQPEELTGTLVRETRDGLKMSRDRFAEEVGFTAKAAVWRIEEKDRWKPGERELVARYLNTLENVRTPGDAGSATPLPLPDDDANERSRERQLLGQCGPCVHGHHSSCRRPVSATMCCDGQVVSDFAGSVASKRAEIRQAHEAGLHSEVKASNCDLCVAETSSPGITWLLTGTEDDEDVVTTYLGEIAGPAPLRVVPDWDPTDPGVGPYVMSNGQRATWQRCRRKWWLGWYLRYATRSEDLTGVRATGNRVHRALSSWYVADGQPRVDPRDALERVIVDDWTRVKAQAEETGASEDQLAGLARKFEQAAQLERVMIAGYVEWLAESGADQELRVVASETVLQADLDAGPGSPWFERPVRVIGLVDARLIRMSDEAYLFEDHKTVASLTDVLPFLPQNEQMLHYELLQWLTSGDADRRCDGALYNMFKRSKRTDRATPPFYSRVEVRHNEGELESYKRRLLAITRDVVRAVDRLNAGEHHLDVVPPTPTKDCRRDCDFAAICPLFDDPTARVEDALTSLYVTVDPHSRYSIR